jgi:DNA recombination protein RmuC
MTPLLLAGLIAVIAVALAAWSIGQARARTAMETAVRSGEARAAAGESRAAAGEARSEELRRQLDAVQIELHLLQEKLQESETTKTAAQTRVAETEKNLLEQKALLEEAGTKLSDTFKALASDVLAGNNTRFLELAQEKFKTLSDAAASDLDNRHKAVEALIGPLAETVRTYQKESKEIEEKRMRETLSVGEQLRLLAQAQGTLQGETTKLANALRSNQSRGRWGEMTLRRTAELAGMSPYCDFVEQESVATDTGRLRPDMIVKLPNGREVVVDSKVPLSGFLEALEAKTEEDQRRAMDKHASCVSQHVTRLASKEYWSQFASPLEGVVLFIPNDSFLSAAVERDPALLEEALSKKIFIATPMTLIALLRAISYGWRQEQMAENAREISQLGQELSDRVGVFATHFNQVAKGLFEATKSYNGAVASFESRILPSMRKLKELGAGGKKEIDPVAPLDQVPRSLQVVENQ